MRKNWDLYDYQAGQFVMCRVHPFYPDTEWHLGWIEGNHALCRLTIVYNHHDGHAFGYIPGQEGKYGLDDIRPATMTEIVMVD